MKYIILLFVCIFTFNINLSAQEELPKRKKVGVVLSGGGAKGVAHIGVLKAIEEAGIPIDYVVGTSMGSIIGGLYAIGYSPEQLDSVVRSQDWTFLLTDQMKRKNKNMHERENDEKYILSVPFSKTSIKEITGGVIKGQNIGNLFSELTLGYHDSIDFNKLPIPYACVAEDIATGKEVVFHNGVLSTAMRASMAIPGVFTPVRMNNMVLVDGGVSNNYPVDVARQMGADIVIGVDVQSTLKSAKELNNAGNLLGQLIDLMGQDKYQKNLKSTDLHIKVDVKGYSAASFSASAIDSLLYRGEAAGKKNFDSLIKLKEKIEIPTHYHHKREHNYEPVNWVMIDKIRFVGLDEKDQKWIKKRCDLEENSLNSIKHIEETSTIIRANTNYSGVTYRLIPTPQGEFDLEYKFQKKQEHLINIGVRFDTEEVASLLVNAQTTLKTKTTSYVSATLRLGKQYGGKLSIGIEPSALTTLSLSYQFNHNDIDFYQSGERSFNSTFRCHKGEISYNNVWLRNIQFGIGVNFELYDYSQILHNSTNSEFKLSNEHFFNYFAHMHYDTFDKAYFPKRGVMMHGSYNLHTDNLLEFKNGSPFSSIMGAFEGVIPITNRFSLLPSIYGRFLIGNNVPFAKMNVMGGDIMEKYLPYQLPFAGTTRVELMDNSLLIGGIKFRQRMGGIHYLTLSANYALSSDKLEHLLKERTMFGCAVSYGMDSMFGPLEATLNYTNKADKVEFYLNLGYKF